MGFEEELGEFDVMLGTSAEGWLEMWEIVCDAINPAEDPEFQVVPSTAAQVGAKVETLKGDRA